MNQLKVFEFAKEIGVETLALMDKIREWKLPVRSHMATLDEQMMADIKTRLQQASQAAAEDAAKAKKKAVRKKAAADAAEAGTKPAEAKAKAKAKAPPATKKAAATKAAAPAGAKSAAGKTPNAKATATKASAKKTVVEETAPRVAPVIRRKAGEAEAKALELAAQAEALAAAAAEQQLAEAQALGEGGAEPGLSAAGETEAGAPRSEEVKRRNIVGRMDLRRVANIQPVQSQGGAALGAAGQPRVSRTAPRNIRTGFY